MKDTTDDDQITNLTFNNFINYAQTLQTTGYYSTLKNSVVQSKQGGKVPQIHIGRGWLRDISTNEWKDYNVNTKDGVSTVKVFHLQQNKTDAGLVKGANQYGNEVMKIFQHCESAPTVAGVGTQKHIFFVVDVGDHFRNKILKKIQALPGNTERIFIHTIHSNETLSDPAGKNNPANKSFIYTQPLTNNNKFFCLSWLYSSEVSATNTGIITTIKNNEPLPITSYNLKI